MKTELRKFTYIFCLGFIALGISSKLSGWLSSPKAPIGGPIEASPVFITDLPFDGSIESIHWSPSGNYIAVVGKARDRNDFSKRHRQVTVVAVARKGIVASLSLAASAIEPVRWTDQDHLWVRQKDSWIIYHQPFNLEAAGTKPVPSRFWRRVKDAYNSKQTELTCDPITQTSLVLSVYQWAQCDGRAMWLESNRSLEVWQQGKRLYKLPFNYEDNSDTRTVKASMSPNSNFVILSINGGTNQRNEENGEIWLLNREKGTLKRLTTGKAGNESTNSRAQDVEVGWSKDSKAIVFRGTQFGLNTYDVIQEQPREVTPTKYTAYNPQFSADGHWIGFRFFGNADMNCRVAFCRSNDGTWLTTTENLAASTIQGIAWHPYKNLLAWTAYRQPRKSSASTSGPRHTGSKLYLWDLQKVGNELPN